MVRLGARNGNHSTDADPRRGTVIVMWRIALFSEVGTAVLVRFLGGEILAGGSWARQIVGGGSPDVRLPRTRAGSSGAARIAAGPGLGCRAPLPGWESARAGHNPDC